MTTVTYFICGLRVISPVTFTLTAGTPPPHPMPDLKVRKKDAGDASVAAVEKTWTVALSVGDHILWVEGPDDDQWQGGELSVNVTELVKYDAGASPPVLQGWGAATATVAAKDPWPPPAGPKTVSDGEWFLTQFALIPVIAPKGL